MGSLHSPLHFYVAPTRSPHNSAVITTSRSINITWSPIECIERNGFITNYTVELRLVGGDLIPGILTNNSFTAIGLTHNTYYNYRIAGINIDGIGPFSNALSIRTNGQHVVFK